MRANAMARGPVSGQRGQHLVEVVLMLAVLVGFVWAITDGLMILINNHHAEFSWAASLPL